MKLSLVVLSEGKASGKTIPIPVSPFLVGRGQQCHLRPVSALVTEQHCALVMKDGRAFLRDFGSANGSFVNDRRVTGEYGLRNDDVLTVGPLRFRLVIDRVSEPVQQPREHDRKVASGVACGPGASTRKGPVSSSAAAAAILSQYLRRDRS
jgi:pSer/pThr/pTyr-binding forkhead associated (FHA) protein